MALWVALCGIAVYVTIGDFSVITQGSYGLGVRVISGERTGYAYTDDLAPERILHAARTAAVGGRSSSHLCCAAGEHILSPYAKLSLLCALDYRPRITLVVGHRRGYCGRVPCICL